MSEQMVASEAFGAEQAGADIQLGTDEVTISDLMQSEEQDSQTVAAEPMVDAPEVQPSSDDGSGETVNDQRSFDTALSKRLESERNKYHNSPEFRLGKMLLEERSKRDNVDSSEAYERIIRERNDARAKEYAQNPEQFYRDFLNSQNEPRQQDGGIDAEANALSRKLIEARENGTMPNGFGKDDINAEFVTNMKRYGMDAAFKIWQASKGRSEAEELQAQRNAPQPMRVSGTSVRAPQLDFENMSSKDFAEFERKIQRAHMEGKTIRFR